MGFLQISRKTRCNISTAMSFIGAMAFFASFPASKYIAEHYGAFSIYYKVDAGYMLGYIFGFAIFIIKQIWKGRISYFVSGHGVDKALSYFMLFFVILFGLISFFTNYFGKNTGDYFHASFVVGSSMIAFIWMAYICRRPRISKK